MLQDDAPGACARVLDSMLLEKIKQLEAVDYYPEAPDDIRPSRIRWAEAEQIIVERYSLEEFRAIKRNGFTDQSLENRCRTIGELSAYNTIYRNFSRNVHSTDYVEQFGGDLVEPNFSEFLETRNNIMLGVARNSVKWVMDWVNNLLDIPLDTNPKESGT